MAKQVCPRLRDSASCCGANSRNLENNFLAISVLVSLSRETFHSGAIDLLALHFWHCSWEAGASGPLDYALIRCWACTTEYILGLICKKRAYSESKYHPYRIEIDQIKNIDTAGSRDGTFRATTSNLLDTIWKQADRVVIRVGTFLSSCIIMRQLKNAF